MTPDQVERRYEQAVQQLHQLVYWRNEYLRELDAMCCLPMQTKPSEGYVMEFDVRRASQLLDRISLQNVQIVRAVETVNRYASAVGRNRLEWRSQPQAASCKVGAEA